MDFNTLFKAPRAGMIASTAGYYASYGEDLILVVNKLVADWAFSEKVSTEELEAFKSGAVSVINFMENCYRETERVGQNLVEVNE